MASILEFRVLPNSKPSSLGNRNSDMPNIVIFPGVRYERWSEAPQPEEKKHTKAKRQKCKRAD